MVNKGITYSTDVHTNIYTYTYVLVHKNWLRITVEIYTKWKTVYNPIVCPLLKVR